MVAFLVQFMSSNQNNLTDLASKLVRIQSTSDKPEQLKQAAQAVVDFLSDQPELIVKKYERNGKPSVVVLTQDTLEPDILFCGHLDVVPADEKMFEPVLKDGRLYGRGFCDMKSGAAVLLSLMKNFAQNPLPVSLGLMLTTDEEIGGQNGVGHLVNEIGYRAKMVIAPDGGNGPDQVIVKNKGLLHLKLTAKGKKAHASRPWEGTNAIHLLLQELNNIRQLFPDLKQEEWTDTLSIGVIEGGQAVNQVADQASACLDIRLTEKTNPEEILSRIREAAPGCELEILARGDVSLTNPEHPFLKLYKDVLKSKMSLDADFRGTPGGNDGRYFTRFGIPVLIVRPLSGGLHGPEEWLDAEGFKNYADLLEDYVIELAEMIRSPGTG